MLRSNYFLTTLLASGLVFSRAQAFLLDSVIGYATVSAEAAESNNLNNELYFDETITRLGAGVYVVNNPLHLESEGWACVIKADTVKFNQVGKVWIPKSYQRMTADDPREQENIWDESEEVIVDYIQTLMPEPGKALRFSWVRNRTNWQLRMLIPTKVVERDDLDLRADCFESRDMMINEVGDIVPWLTWTIQGQSGGGAPSLK
ncbi:hypothetical protein MBM_06513 [Drepanopeziza brunnea f. sp. 'multigermtubi' MB_m1]|uniref:Uncharacterized protein n=1 Tax=Marssonina brunnea f. sp. multigermtubi (strain MB_m1) TaxID=1072389 RepID=K1WSD3_MARBU|nr:uncharacterized protein MBM_06513 [Drepanopeziza brunnea f. sp. 'multigermtubi' MB_m1]EKD15297.1 hypothetical protein MBM_06513 [Drepanopeziza brunnea f. sp. 'multigermtubi' MB_m1]